MKMKREVATYLIMAALVVVAFLLIYSFSFRFTGQVVLEQYENQTACEEAGYVWEDVTNETCSEIVGCVIGVTGCVDTCEECVDEVTGQECSDLNYTTQEDCETVEETWDDIIEQNCTTILDCVIGVTGCVDTCEECVDEIIRGQCIGDCGVGFLELCNETNCVSVGGGYWYNDVCNAEEQSSCSNDLGLCLTEEECTDADGYWYDANEDGNSTCNSDECVSNSDCDSDYECSDGSCVKIATKEPEEPEEPEESLPPPISFTSSEILPLSVNPGSSQESSVIVTNTGETPLSSCMLKLMGGELDSWISISEEIININPNEERGFSFSVAVPEETEENSYSLKVATLCSNMYKIHDFVVNVEKKKLEFEVISADRTRSNRVRIIYSLEELAGEEQNVVFTFSLVDVSNAEMGNAEVNQSIDANSTDEFRINIEINESLLPINETTNETLESELTLNVNFNSEIYSSSVRETITLGAPIGGFAIFEGVGAGEAIIFVIVLFVLVFIFIFARRMRRKGKTLKDLFKGSGPEPTK